jgi:hypothetical protein
MYLLYKTCQGAPHEPIDMPVHQPWSSQKTGKEIRSESCLQAAAVLRLFVRSSHPASFHPTVPEWLSIFHPCSPAAILGTWTA